MKTVQNHQPERLDVGKRPDLDTLIATMMEIRASLNRMIGMLEAQADRPLLDALDTESAHVKRLRAQHARRPWWSAFLAGLGIAPAQGGSQHDERP